MDNAKNGRVAGAIPYGYKSGEDCKLEIDEGKAAIVREVFQRVSEGENYIDIANDFNARGLRTSRGALWNKNSFRSMLANERYRGIYIFSEYRKEGGLPRIISDELFYKVQDIVKSKRAVQGRHGTTNADYLLTGKLYCGHCGSYMVGKSGTSKTGEVHYYYACQSHLKHECHKKNVRKDYIERVVAQTIMSDALTDEMIEYITDQSIEFFKRKEADSQAAILENELVGVNVSIKNIIKAIEAGIITETTRARLLELESEKARLEGQIAAEKASIIQIDRDQMIEGMKLFRQGNIKDRKFLHRLFDTFLVAVYLYDDHLKLVFSFSGDKHIKDVPINLTDGGFSELSPQDRRNVEEKSSHKLSKRPP